MNAFRKLIREGEERLGERFLAEQRAEFEWDNLSDREREEAGRTEPLHNEKKVLRRITAMKTKLIQRDIVDMVYDDGLTPKEALEIEKLRPIGFLGKDILAIRKEVKPVVKDSKAYRIEPAHEFRKAIEALPPNPEKTCGRCGVDVGAVDDHKIVDREPMCNACVGQYFPEGIER